MIRCYIVARRVIKWGQYLHFLWDLIKLQCLDIHAVWQIFIYTLFSLSFFLFFFCTQLLQSKCLLVGNSLELLVFPGAADLGGEPLSQLLQAARVLQLNLRFAAEELLQVLQQLDTWLRLLLQAFELFHQLVTDLCPSKEKKIWVNCLCRCHNSAQRALVKNILKRSSAAFLSCTSLFGIKGSFFHTYFSFPCS